MENFEKIFAESIADFHFNPNEIILAEVIHVDRHKVVVDVGLHTEGTIQRTEFNESPSVGDKIKVVVEALDDGEGQLKISHKEVMLREQSELIPSMVENNEIIDVKVVSVAPAGLNIVAGYLGGFIPRKLVDIEPVTDYEAYVGKTVRAKVLSYDSTHENLVVSRKAALIDERGGVIPALDRELNTGDVIEGKVINIKRYGVFVDIGGVSSLLHISDLNWNNAEANPESFSVGDRLEVIVKKKDEDSGRYFLSVKHIDMTPWELAKTALTELSTQKATVLRVEDNGDVRVSVLGVSGVIAQSDVSWTRMTTSSINAEFRRGMEVDVQVIGFNDTFGFEEVLLSRKACISNPWDELSSSFKVGDIIEASIKSVSDKMVFVNVHEDIDAIVPVREISWANPEREIQKLNVGDKVKALLISIDIEDRRVVASMKQVEKNPFTSIKRNTKLMAKVTSIAKNGDVQVSCGKHTGVILSRNAVPSKAYKSEEIYEIGQELECVVINIFSNSIINLNVVGKWENPTGFNKAIHDALVEASK